MLQMYFLQCHLCLLFLSFPRCSLSSWTWKPATITPTAATITPTAATTTSFTDISKSVATKQKLETQLLENTIVKEELDLLDETNTVYKLVGPVLVKQDLEEAKSTVGKRLEYITAEKKRCEIQLTDLQKQSEQHRESLSRLHQELKKAQVKAAASS
uniref:prefoldin subunit 6 isoform X1 n=1 Tax=Myxine glutinosa TaxID=7769 RepID=UPI00358F3CB1